MRHTRKHLMVAGALLLGTGLVGAAARGTIPGSSTAAAGAEFAAPAGGVRFGGHLDRTAVLRGQDGTVRMELVIASDAPVARREVRVPTDLVVVLDRSGSMAGDKIAHARNAVLELIAQLDARDRFALVTYANDAAITIALETASVEAKRAWTSRVAEIGPDGGTNMSSGLDLGLDLVEGARTSGRVPRTILISDGLANQGDASHDGLLRRGARAARGEYVLSTIGVGADFNEYLMAALADAGTGNYYFLRGSEDLAQVFAREFDAARTTVASGLAVEIAPSAGVHLIDAGGYPLEQTGDTVIFRPGSLFAGQERRVWVTFAVPNDTLGEHALGRFALAYDDGRERRTTAFTETPRITCVAREEEFFAKLDKPAWTRSLVVDVYNKMQAEVAEDVKSGRRDEALGKLHAFKDAAASLNAQVQSPPVATQIMEADKLEREVAAAFEGPDQPARQNDFSKAKSAAAVDARRAGNKK